jgi:Antitoxin MazE-like
MATSARPSRDKVRAHRERLRQQGLRPIQIWVPDVRSPAFKAEAHRQSLAVAQSPHADEDQAFIDRHLRPGRRVRRGGPGRLRGDQL